MKKKLVAILLVAAMVLSLVACGKDNGTSDPGKPSSNEGNDAGKKYTFHGYLASGTITSFSPTDWQLNSESQLMSPCTSPLYQFN